MLAADEPQVGGHRSRFWVRYQCLISVDWHPSIKIPWLKLAKSGRKWVSGPQVGRKWADGPQVGERAGKWPQVIMHLIMRLVMRLIGQVPF